MVGIGYDIHRFTLNRPLILGGVEIPHSHGLEGHSDADVLSHAIADAILGAAGLPDIGHWFPPSDPAHKNLCSLEILKKTVSLIHEEGLKLVNVDATIIAQVPKLLPYREAMRQKISHVLQLSVARVGIKATTNEWLGAIGRGEGIAAMAVASTQQS